MSEKRINYYESEKSWKWIDKNIPRTKISLFIRMAVKNQIAQLSPLSKKEIVALLHQEGTM